MKTTLALVASVALLAACVVRADYSVQNRGAWPTTWPKELDPLRKQSRTLEGPLGPRQQHHIPFTKREEFESAWPHLLQVKSKGAPLVLVRAPYTRLGTINAGVIVHTPGETKAPGKAPALPEPLASTYIVLIVDGDIVDLNRIPLPPETPIVDQRFTDTQKKSLDEPGR